MYTHICIHAYIHTQTYISITISLSLSLYISLYLSKSIIYIYIYIYVCQIVTFGPSCNIGCFTRGIHDFLTCSCSATIEHT